MTVVRIGTYIDNILNYTNLAKNGEIIEIIFPNGEILQLTKKEKEE